MAFKPVSFSPLGSSRRKLLHVIPAGCPEGQPQGVLRSLKLEHVFPAELIRKESLRPTALGTAARNAIANGGPVPDDLMFSLLRRWYWSRKADSGFCIHGFPATRLQARVLDEWLESRDEMIDACVVSDSTADHEVAGHYRMIGVPVVTEARIAS